MKAKHKKAARRKKQPNVWKSALLALPLALVLGLLLLLLTTAILLATKDPIRYHTVAGLAVLYLTALLGGFSAARICGRQFPLLCGLLTGAGLLFLFTVPTLFVSGTVSELGTYGLLLRLPVLPLSLLGAFLSCRKKAVRRGR